MTPLRFVLPLNGGEQELFVSGEIVRSVLLPAVEHEVGHIIVAAHYGAAIFVIGIGFLPEKSNQGVFFQAIYGWENCPADTQCIVKAAGPAADLLYRGCIDDQAAKWDLIEIEALSGKRFLEPYLTEAKTVLSGYQSEMAWVSERLRAALTDGKERRLEILPNRRLGALFLDEAQLRECP